MKIREKFKKIRGLIGLCPVAHIIAALSALVIICHVLLRDNYEIMSAISRYFVRPAHKFLGSLWDVFPFSVAELLIAAGVVALIVLMIISIRNIIVRGQRVKGLYKLFMRLCAAGLAVYGGFCLLWGAFFYGEDFISAAGLENEKISLEQLETVTEYFARQANYYSQLVQRDESGAYVCDRQEILQKSRTLYRQVQESFPSLSGPELRAKPVFFSRIMSYIDFTGFFFPFTAEANVNMDFPPSLFPSTVAHELAHQRGVAKEQEANFVAVLACFENQDPDYCYSASLLAYTHLGNALYSADYQRWKAVYSSLDEAVLRDFQVNREYWEQFETPVQTVSNTVYEGFLYSYDQDLGLKSYGACVDLLVNYYYDEAVACLN